MTKDESLLLDLHFHLRRIVVARVYSSFLTLMGIIIMPFKLEGEGEAVRENSMRSSTNSSIRAKRIQGKSNRSRVKSSSMKRSSSAEIAVDDN